MSRQESLAHQQSGRRMAKSPMSAWHQRDVASRPSELLCYRSACKSSPPLEHSSFPLQEENRMKLKHMASIAILVLASLLTQAQAWSQDKTLKVGSTPTGVPFTFLDTKTNTIEGIMVD